MTTPHLTAQLRHVVRAASLAPGVDSPQPWSVRRLGDGFDLLASADALLPLLGAGGQSLHLSAGSALLRARVAARALGLDCSVSLLPDPDRPDHLARLQLAAGPAADDTEIALALALLKGHAVRRPFARRPLPPSVLAALRSAAEQEGTSLHSLRRDGDSALREALLCGTDDAADVVVLATDDDTPQAWLRAGMALGRLVLRAADAGVQAQPLARLTELAGRRTCLTAALGSVGVPQVVLRLGYGATEAATEAATHAAAAVTTSAHEPVGVRV